MIEWEELDHDLVYKDTEKEYFALRRAQIPGGWLVAFFKFALDPDMAAGAGFGGLTFVPDLNHEWDGDSL